MFGTLMHMMLSNLDLLSISSRFTVKVSIYCQGMKCVEGWGNPAVIVQFAELSAINIKCVNDWGKLSSDCAICRPARY